MAVIDDVSDVAIVIDNVEVVVVAIIIVSVWKSSYETGKKTITGPDHNRPRPQLVKTGKDREMQSG